jgi:hypothetical protein
MVTFGIFGEIKREADAPVQDPSAAGGARIAALANADEERAT